MKFGKVKLFLLFLLIGIFISGCISNKDFWHPDNRKRIPFFQTLEISEDERDILEYMVWERLIRQRKRNDTSNGHE